MYCQRGVTFRAEVLRQRNGGKTRPWNVRPRTITNFLFRYVFQHCLRTTSIARWNISCVYVKVASWKRMLYPVIMFIRCSNVANDVSWNQCAPRSTIDLFVILTKSTANWVPPQTHNYTTWATAGTGHCIQSFNHFKSNLIPK